MRFLAIAIFLCLAFPGVVAQRTTRQHLNAAVQAGQAASIPDIRADTIKGEDLACFTVTGYEKPLRSTRETLMLHAAADAPAINAILLILDYSDMSGRQLHSRTLAVPTDVAAGQTRMLTFRSWDVNKVFYYHLNRPPRTSAQGTPYAVRVTVVGALISREKD